MLKFSIVTPSLNQAQYLSEALRSVQEQTYPNYEHIVIDGGSTDDTLRILKEFSGTGTLRWVSEPDRGQADALNKGFRLATGDVIGWLNADDRYLPGCFEEVSEFFDRNPGVDVVYGDYRFIDHAGRVLRYRKEIDYDLFILKYLHVLYIPSTASFFRRSIFDEGYYLKEEYHYAMDYEFFLRLALSRYRFAHISRYLADFRWHSSSKSTTAPRKQRQEREKALMELDPLMRALPGGVRLPMRQLLLLAARGKRTWMKLVQGSYWVGLQ